VAPAGILRVIERSDETLLAALDEEPEAFAEFYRRHVTALLGYFVRRTRDPELAADLCAETFAAALAGAHRFRPERGPAIAWLYGIARRQLAHARRRGAVEDRARRQLGMAPLALTDEALERIDALATAEASATALHAALDSLPADQREALEARVVDERGYDEIALAARTSASVVRKRVSRGLAGLRARMGGEAR
jgi:RNA polymerase sigma-70 factor (ECF subfamily)